MEILRTHAGISLQGRAIACLPYIDTFYFFLLTPAFLDSLRASSLRFVRPATAFLRELSR
jgi:hypothetical protein